MSEDYLIKLGQNKLTQIPLGALGVSFPVELKRAESPWSEKELEGNSIGIASFKNGRKDLLIKIAEESGAKITEKPSSEKRVNALIFNATGIHTVDEAKALYTFFHENIRNTKSNARLIVIAENPEETESFEAQAVSQGIQAFTKSLAKEVGRKGSTAQLITISKSLLASSDDLEKKLNPVLVFLLSKRSAFISGQVFSLSNGVKTSDKINLALSLKGKVALVTGAARGIGKSTATRLAEEGATVIILDRPEDEEHSQKVAEEIGGKVLSLDISNPDTPQKIVDYVSTEFNGLDIIVHNAGITRDKTIGKMSETFWDLSMAVNFKAVLRVTEALLEKGLNDGGRIIGLSSISGIAGNFGQTNYTMTKGGIMGLVSALAPKLADRGITANAVAPGLIETRMTEAMPFFTREGGRRLSNLSQGGLPIDIAEMITFLSTPGASGISGQTIRVCGGSMMGA